MPEFKNREEYERWKAMRAAGIKEAPPPSSASVGEEGIKTSEEKEDAPLTEKKCPYCYAAMNFRASVCPSCKKKVGGIGKNGVAVKYYNVGYILLVVFLVL